MLFPAFRGIVSAHEFDSLGEDFEKKKTSFSATTDFSRWWIASWHRKEARHLRTVAVHAEGLMK